MKWELANELLAYVEIPCYELYEFLVVNHALARHGARNRGRGR